MIVVQRWQSYKSSIYTLSTIPTILISGPTGDVAKTTKAVTKTLVAKRVSSNLSFNDPELEIY